MVKLPNSFPPTPTEEDYSSSSSSDSDSSSSSSTSSPELAINLGKLPSPSPYSPSELELGCRTFAAVPPRRYTCEDCSMTFNKASALAEHIRGSHPTNVPAKPTTTTTTTTTTTNNLNLNLNLRGGLSQNWSKKMGWSSESVERNLIKREKEL